MILCPFEVLCVLSLLSLGILRGFFCSAPCQSIFVNTSVFTCLTGQLSLHFWCLLTSSSLFSRCCQTHDNCYTQAKKLPACTTLVDNPYTETYKFSCSNEAITCSSTSSSVSLCFAQHFSCS